MDEQAFELLMDKLKTHDEKFNSLEEKVDLILKFKWQIIGGSAVISGFVAIIVQVFVLLDRG